VAVVLLIAAVAIIVGVVAVARGRGGELAHFAADAPRWDAELATAADVALLRPPSALFGYSVQATDDALGQIALLVTERDAQIASLRSRIAELQDRLETLTAQGPAAADRQQPAPPPTEARSGPVRRPGRPATRPDPQTRPGSPDAGWSAWDRPARPDQGAAQDSG